MKNSFCILPTMLILSMSTADGKISCRLSNSISAILPIRTISPLMRTVSPSVSWDYVFIKMDMMLPNTGRNTKVQNQSENIATFVSGLVRRRNPAEGLPLNRSKKREKKDYKLEDGRHRSMKMWYCRFRHSTRYIQCSCLFLANFFSCTIFSCQFSVVISFIEIPRSYIIFFRILVPYTKDNKLHFKNQYCFFTNIFLFFVNFIYIIKTCLKYRYI